MFNLSAQRCGAALVSLGLAMLAGCAVEKVAIGTPRADVLAQYGQPTQEVMIASGSRLQYSRQPSGQTAVMVDLDSQGRVVSSRQVLQSADFSRIVIGQWRRADIEREFGRSASVDWVASWSGDIMTYRWKDATQDMFFYVYLDAANVVQRVGQGMDLRKSARRY